MPAARSAVSTDDPSWGSAQVRAVCQVLAQPGYPGLPWSTLKSLLWNLGIEPGAESEDAEPADCRAALHRRLMSAQAGPMRGGVIATFITEAMNPATFSDRSQFEALREGVNRALRFKALSVDPTGDLHHPETARGSSSADSVAERLRTELVRRGSHPETLRYCDDRLIDRSLFHAMFQASRGLATRIRGITGLKSDGLILVNDAFSTKAAHPPLRLSDLMTETDIGEHRGLEGLIRGVFNTFRGNSADLPRVTRTISEQDALEVFGTLSYIHRRLDSARAN